MAKDYKALMVVTSHQKLGETIHKTGFHLCEVTHPLFELERAGIVVDIASPEGGPVKMDESSRDLSDPINRDYMERETFLYRLNQTLCLKEIEASHYNALIVAGGYGALWDLTKDQALSVLIQQVVARGGVIGAIGQGVASLASVFLESGVALVQGRKVCSMTNREIFLAGLGDVVPCFPEDLLVQRGAVFTSGPHWHKFVVVDSQIITGQGSKAAQAVGEQVCRQLLKGPAADAPTIHK